MGLNVRVLGAEGARSFEWNPAFGHPIPSDGESYNHVTIVDQSFQRVTGQERNMNTRKRHNLLNRRNQSGGAGRDFNRIYRSETLKSNSLKNRVKLGIEPEVRGRIPVQLLNHAVAEAEALAWSTPYPLLFLPGLVEEKVLDAGKWASRQREILERRNIPASDSLAIAE